MEVISLSSSPEPSASRKNTRNARRQPESSRKRRRSAPGDIVVIELSDSEDDDPRESTADNEQPSRQNENLAAGPNVPGPSNGQTALPSSGGLRPDLLRSAEAERGSLQHPHRGPNPDVPLFYPAEDDRERSPLPLPAVALSPPLPASDLAPDAVPLPPSPPVPAVDPADEYVASVLEIIPDVQPAHVLGLVEQFMKTHPTQVVELVLHSLFENPSYPKIDKKGKRKRDEEEAEGALRGSPKPKIDYACKDREYNCGPHYFELSLSQLMLDFPRIPKPHIRSRLLDNRFYAVTYLALSDDLKQDALPFKMKVTNSVVSSKGKGRHDPEFDRERQWILLKIQEMAATSDATLANQLNEQEYEDTGDGIECGCCFSSYPFDHMIQCPETHLFCKTCMTSYASNLLGEHNPNIVCMDQSGCKVAFPESELQRFLSAKLLDLYQRVKQRKEIEAAGLDNLEECPHCEYKCVIDNEMEKLFHCENAECGAVTCRACKKPDHLPRSCKEMEEDNRLDAQHIVEEAMTRALMRNCPKCQKPFIKEMGCNKMMCPNCGTMSCYVCRKIITGYEHFAERVPSHRGSGDKPKCLLWDALEQRPDEEVSAAAKRALEELRRDRPEIDHKDIKIDIPKPRTQGRAGPPPPHMPVPMGARPLGFVHNEYARGLAFGHGPQAGPAHANNAMLAHAQAMQYHMRQMQQADRARRELERRHEELNAIMRGIPARPAIPPIPPFVPHPPPPPPPPPPVPVHAPQPRRRRTRY